MIRFSITPPSSLSSLKLINARLLTISVDLKLRDQGTDGDIIKKLFKVTHLSSGVEPQLVEHSRFDITDVMLDKPLEYQLSLDLEKLSDEKDKLDFYQWIIEQQPLKNGLAAKVEIVATTLIRVKAHDRGWFFSSNKRKLTKKYPQNTVTVSSEEEPQCIKNELTKLLKPLGSLEGISGNLKQSDCVGNIFNIGLKSSLVSSLTPSQQVCEVLKTAVQNHLIQDIERSNHSREIEVIPDGFGVKIELKRENESVYSPIRLGSKDYSPTEACYFRDDCPDTLEMLLDKPKCCNKNKIVGRYEQNNGRHEVHFGFSLFKIKNGKPESPILKGDIPEAMITYPKDSHCHYSQVTMEVVPIGEDRAASYLDVRIVIDIDTLDAQTWFVSEDRPKEQVALHFDKDHLLNLDNFEAQCCKDLYSFFGNTLGLPVRIEDLYGSCLCFDIGTSSMTAAIYSKANQRTILMELVSGGDDESNKNLLRIEDDTQQCPTVFIATKKPDSHEEQYNFHVLTDKESLTNYRPGERISNIKTFTRTGFDSSHPINVIREGKKPLKTRVILDRAYSALLLLEEKNDSDAPIVKHSLKALDDNCSSITGIRYAIPNMPVSMALRGHFRTLSNNLKDKKNLVNLNLEVDSNFKLVSESEAAFIDFVTRQSTPEETTSSEVHDLLNIAPEQCVNAVLMDVGAGTTDISLAEIRRTSHGLFNITLVNDSSTDLAGNFFELLIAQACYQYFLEHYYLAQEVDTLISQTIGNDSVKQQVGSELQKVVDYCITLLIEKLDLLVTGFNEANDEQKEDISDLGASEARMKVLIELVALTYEGKKHEGKKLKTKTISFSDHTETQITNRENHSDNTEYFSDKLTTYKAKIEQQFTALFLEVDVHIRDFVNKLKAHYGKPELDSHGLDDKAQLDNHRLVSPVDYIYLEGSNIDKHTNFNLALKSLAETIKFKQVYQGLPDHNIPLLRESFALEDLLAIHVELPIGYQPQQNVDLSQTTTGMKLSEWIKYVSIDQIDAVIGKDKVFKPKLVVLTGRGGMWQQFQQAIKDGFAERGINPVYGGLLEHNTLDDEEKSKVAKYAVIKGLSQSVFWREKADDIHHGIWRQGEQLHVKYYVAFRKGAEFRLCLLEKGEAQRGMHPAGNVDVFMTNQTWDGDSKTAEGFYWTAFRIKSAMIKGITGVKLHSPKGQLIVSSIENPRDNIFDKKIEQTGTMKLAHWPNRF